MIGKSDQISKQMESVDEPFWHSNQLNANWFISHSLLRWQKALQQNEDLSTLIKYHAKQKSNGQLAQG